MPTCADVRREISSLTQALIKLGLIDKYNFPRNRVSGGGREELFAGQSIGGIGYGAIPYKEVYAQVEESNAFNYQFLDGALVSLQYLFSGRELIKHRLCFWASPSLEAFQNDPDLYNTDDLYADFMEPSIVPFPFRFDYSSDTLASVNCPIHHPRSHVSFGMYKGCRIPVDSPMSPCAFIMFILRNFYNTSFRKYSEELNLSSGSFAESIYPEERNILHFVAR